MSCIPDSKAQDSGFRKEKFPHSEIRIPLHYLVSNRERLVRVGLLWDKQHEPHIEISNILKFGVYRDYIERVTRYSQEIYRRPDDVSGKPYMYIS